MTEEVRANMSFGHMKRGDRLQVDIHDPAVAGLIKGGYLRIAWKGDGDARTLDSAVDPAGFEPVPAGSVDPDDSGDPQDAEEVADGQGEHRPGQEGGHSS
jgi:hypothetical protein